MQTASAPAEHWDQAYGHGDATRSWFQREPSWSLRMIDRTGIGPVDSVIDVGGGSSPLPLPCWRVGTLTSQCSTSPSWACALRSSGLVC
jgi:hypothetical protein